MVNHPGVLLAIAGSSFLSNIAMGQLRARARKFTASWFLWVHLSVPFIIALRLHYGLKPAYVAIPALVLCAAAGQVLGGRLGAVPGLAAGSPRR